MTEKEYNEIWKQIAERKRRTSFPAPSREAARQQFESRASHAEYGVARH